MSFMLRVDDGRDFELGPTFPVLGALGRIAALIEPDEEKDFGELLSIIETNEEPVTADFIVNVAKQAARLVDRAGKDAWLLDRLTELKEST